MATLAEHLAQRQEVELRSYNSSPCNVPQHTLSVAVGRCSPGRWHRNQIVSVEMPHMNRSMRLRTSVDRPPATASWRVACSRITGRWRRNIKKLNVKTTSHHVVRRSILAAGMYVALWNCILSPTLKRPDLWRLIKQGKKTLSISTRKAQTMNAVLQTAPGFGRQ